MITIGADPELFIIDNTTGNVVSSIGLIPGVKKNAWVDPEWENGFGLETDNILAEFNIPPTNSMEEFVNSIEFMKNYIRDFVKKTNPNYDIKCCASLYVPEDQLNSPEAKLFGCDVDYNVYTKKPNPKPKGENTNLRSAGCHIHVGYDNKSQKKSLEMIKYMDLYLGVPSVVLDPDTERRKLYGKAGCFRLTPYGFEYRSLSSYFINTRELIEFCYKNTIKAITAYYVDAKRPDEVEIIECINNNNVELAKEIINKYNILD